VVTANDGVVMGVLDSEAISKEGRAGDAMTFGVTTV
jgi:hypothetical protein